MCTCRQFLLSILLPIILISETRSAFTNYGDVLENQLIDDQLRLLGPEGLLRSRRIIRENGIQAVSDTCARDLLIYQRAIDQRESWALKMLDSSSKLPSGMLQGHVIDMGMYDECMEAQGQQNDFIIHGRHCMYEINPTLAKRFILNPTMSICLPASCNANDVVGLLHHAINGTEKLKILGINVVTASCTALPANNASTTFVICGIIGAIYVGFLMFCTLCDLANRQAGKKWSNTLNILGRLSLLKNAETIFSTKVHDSNLPVINGLRVISTFWIVLFHEYLFALIGVNVNNVYITKWFSSWGSMYPLVGTFSVDTFLTISGFLMAYNFFKQIHRTKTFNVYLHYLHRYIRLTFPIAVFLLFSYVFVPTLGSGARYLWIKDIFVTGLSSKWWSYLLYVQNFVEPKNYAVTHLWSLAVDMQLFWISPFILYPLYRWPRFGLTLLVTLIVASATVSGSIVRANKYSAIYFSHDYNMTRFYDAFENVYQMPYTRASPWLIGILLAYIVTHKSNAPNKVLITLGWILAIVSFLFCTLGTRVFTQANYEYDVIKEVTFAVMQRPLWAFGICWIIYTSINNAAGPISKLLSASIFLPLSRISYSIYLVHIVLPCFQQATSRAPRYFHQITIFQSYISNMVIAIILAFFFSLLFEIPALVLEDLIFKRKRIIPEEELKEKIK